MNTLKLFETANGRWWLPTHIESDVIFQAMSQGKVFEPEIVNIAKKYIRLGSTVLDVGSNFGQMAVIFSQVVGKNGCVHAFEADPFICSILRMNIKENGCDNIIVHEGAVWHESGKTLFYPDPDFKRFGSYGSYGIDPQATQGRTVHSFTIDSLNIQEPISFMKVDIQGSDLFALMGAKETITRHNMPIIFEYEEQFQKEFNTSFDDYTKLMKEISYHIDSIHGINYLIKKMGLMKKIRSKIGL